MQVGIDSLHEGSLPGAFIESIVSHGSRRESRRKSIALPAMPTQTTETGDAIVKDKRSKDGYFKSLVDVLVFCGGVSVQRL